ncbi:MAG TPA: NlpC/P60 family protein [Acidimicrobiales bacterium]|nr:NlpC/P60 family protein [Acidimicrobiales bacterium]
MTRPEADSGGTPGPALSPLPAAPDGYALPVPARLVAADPSLIGEGHLPDKTEPAGPVRLPVPAATRVDAVTAGRIVAASDGPATSLIVLAGSDGATYGYRDISASVHPGEHVKPGERIGAAVAGGFTFSIRVPDVAGRVDADEALQSWAAGVTVDIHSLPSTVAPPPAAKATTQVLVVTDTTTGHTGQDLTRALAGDKVTTSVVTDGRPARVTAALRADVARWAARTHGHGLVVAVLAQGTPAEAAGAVSANGLRSPLLWVAPTRTTTAQAHAYARLLRIHPRLRVQSLPKALGDVTAQAATTPTVVAGPDRPGQWSTVGAQAAASLISTYATTAYRLHPASAAASTVISYAEAQLGKPYQWAAAGPNRFDCSGLTMEAFAQVGVGLAHNADAQWLATRRHSVPVTQLAVGDLVFFAGSDGTLADPGHVGIYVGNGEMIDAPYTGTVVRFDPIASVGGYVGASDPLAGTTATLTATGTMVTPSNLSRYQRFAEVLTSATWHSSQFSYLDLLWNRESGWNPTATNPTSGAFGIPQALPATKMATAGADWATDGYTQIVWGIDYIRARYGTPQAAWSHELVFGWY